MPLSIPQIHALETLVAHPFARFKPFGDVTVSAREIGPRVPINPIIRGTTLYTLHQMRLIGRDASNRYALTARGLSRWATDRGHRGVPAAGIDPYRTIALRRGGVHLPRPDADPRPVYELLAPTECATCFDALDLGEPVCRAPAGGGVQCRFCADVDLRDVWLEPFGVPDGGIWCCGQRECLNPAAVVDPRLYAGPLQAAVHA